MNSVYYWKPLQKKTEREDVARVADLAGYRIALVADGITRSRRTIVAPSSREGAKHFVDAAFASLQANTGSVDLGEIHLTRAFQAGNERMASYNETLGIWGDGCNYHERDMVGCVAAIAAQRGRQLLYGYIADSGAAVLNSDCELIRITEDDVATARPHFPRNLPPRKRNEMVRGQLRNTPTKKGFGAYGAFTGEAEAMHFVHTDTWELEEDEFACLYSDGGGLLLRNHQFRQLLSEANGQIQEDAQPLIEQLVANGAQDDERTLLFIT